MSSISAEQHAQFAAEWNPDVSVEKIAAVYAESLLGAGEAQNVPLPALVGEFDSLIDDIVQKEPRFAAILASAMISPEEKTAILDRTLGGKASKLFLNFLKVVAKHGRLDILRDIRRQARCLLDKRLGRVPVTVTTATPLNPDTLQSLTGALRQLIGGDPVITASVDPETIGGIVVRVGDTIYDASIFTQLKNVRQQMIDRSAHEIQSRRDRFSNPEGN
jgi:F-type H+-transporting ATPase subunit delta